MFLVAHYSLMLAWVRVTGTGFCSSLDGVDRPLAELLYQAVMAAIFIFDQLNLTDGRTWRRYASWQWKYQRNQ